MIASPPKELISNPLQLALEKHSEHLKEYIELLSPTDNKGRYLHYDQLRYRFSNDLDKDLAWSIVKTAVTFNLIPSLERSFIKL